jgi:hypothetical protein
MPGVFDRLNADLKAREKESTGPSAMDIAGLPAPQRRVVRMLLRELEMTYPALCETVEKLPAADRFSRAELDEALAALTQQGWLIRLGEAELKTYKVNLRAKAGSTLAGGIWGALGSKIESARPPSSEEEKK